MSAIPVEIKRGPGHPPSEDQGSVVVMRSSCFPRSTWGELDVLCSRLREQGMEVSVNALVLLAVENLLREIAVTTADAAMASLMQVPEEVDDG